MDHESASQMKAPERYVSGDLPVAERDQFEEHFAGCSQCLDQVWTASVFAANARAVFREMEAVQPGRDAVRAAPAAGRGGRWWSFRWQVAIPAVAALVLAAVVVYQGAVAIPALRAPQSFMGAVVLDGATRGALPQVPAAGPLRFQMALPMTSRPAVENGRVWVELLGEAPNGPGRVWSTGWVRTPPSNEPLDIYFPIRLEPGTYILIVRTGPEPGPSGGAELARNRFEATAQGANTP
jgi:hypothetical protein